MKRFYSIKPQYQWLISAACTIVLFLLLIWWVALVSQNKEMMILIFIMVPLIQFLLTPLFTKLRLYTYYSPMVVSFGNTPNVIDLHNGTSFDYLMDMRGVKTGVPWKKKMLKHYLNVLLHIIEQIESGHLSQNTFIRGSSYFISKRSAQKLGFTIHKTSLAEKINIVLNYVDLIWMYSLSNGKLIFPNLHHIKTVRISGTLLVEKKNVILKVLRFVD